MTWKLKLWLLVSLAVSLWSWRSYIGPRKKTVKITDGYMKPWAE